MSSSEEYLDNLLKALLESENALSAGTEKNESGSPEELFASMGGMARKADVEAVEETPESQQKQSAEVESNKAMSPNEIEEMLASMTAEVPEEASQDSEEDALVEQIVNELLPDASGPVAEEAQEPEAADFDTGISDDWALEEDSLPETEEEEGMSDWALEEDSLPEAEEEEGMSDWALEEDPLPEAAELEADSGGGMSDWALEEDSLLEEQEPEIGSSDWALEEDSLPEEPTKEVEVFLDDWALEEDSLPGEPEQEDAFDAGWDLEEEPTQRRIVEDPFMADWALEEELLPEEPEPEENAALEDETLPADMSLDEWSLEEPELPVLDEFRLEEPMLEEDSLEEPELSALEASVPEEPELPVLDEVDAEEPELPVLDEVDAEESELPALDEVDAEEPELPVLDEVDAEEPELPALDEVDAEESELPALDELDAEDKTASTSNEWDLDGLLDLKELGEMGPEDQSAEDSLLLEKLLSDRESAENEIEQEEESTLNEWTLDEETIPKDAVSNTTKPEEDAMSATMSEEDVDRLLGDDFALEESGEEDEGLSALLASMGQDEDLSEINDLLEKADKGLMEDDDMLALLESTPEEGADEGDDAFDFWGKEEEIPIRDRSACESAAEEPEEESPGKKKKKEKKEKKRGKAGRKKTKKGEQDEMELTDKLLSRLGDEEAKPKKKGGFGKLMSLLFEDEDDFPSKDMDVNDADRELGNLSDENRELLAELNEEDSKKKKGKKERKKKEPKKKADDKKDKKPKKAKKPKKEKKPKVEEPKVPEKRISRTKIVFVILFCTSVAVCIIVVNKFIPDYMQRQEACELYEEKQYEKAYELLYGKELNEEETAVLQKSTIILQVRQKLDFYETYRRLNMPMEALNALIEGVERYHMAVSDAQQYGVSGEIEDIYAQILAELSGNYGVSEEDALLILSSEDDLIYNERLYGIINGTGIETETEEEPRVKEDVLPEEEEIINRLEGETLPAEEIDAPADEEDMTEISEEFPEEDL